MEPDTTRPLHIPTWDLSDRLRKVRRDSHLSQRDFAYALGLKETTLAAYESGRNVPQRLLDLAARVESAFDVPAAWLLGVMPEQRPTRQGDRVAPMGHQRRRATDRVVCV